MLVMLGSLLCATRQANAADEAPASNGLRGVLPSEVPDDLTDAIATLPETWKAWGDSLTGVLNDLYTKADLDAAGQRQALATLRGNLATMQVALSDARYRSIGSALTGLHGRLMRRVDMAEATLDTLASSPGTKASLAALLKALDQYEATQSKSAAAEARAAFDAIRSSAGDGGQRITQALSADYLNYNLRVDISQAFLTKLVNQHRTQREEKFRFGDHVRCSF